MRNSDLFWALNDMDESLIREAQTIIPSKQKPTRPWRWAALIAAVVAVLGVTAGAVNYGIRYGSQQQDLHELARKDLGVSEAEAIPEYTEYALSAGPEQSATFNASRGSVQLVSAFCSGEELIVYLSVPNATEEMVLAGQATMDWDVVVSPDYVSSYFLELISYDSNTQTALIKATLFGSFDKAASLALRLEYSGQETGSSLPYEALEFPTTPSRVLQAEVGRSLPVTEQGGVAVSASVSQVQVCAGYLTLCLDAQPCDAVCETLGPDAWSILEQAAGLGLAVENQADAAFCYAKLIKELVNASLLSDAVLNLTDGSSISIDQAPRLFRDVWEWPSSIAWKEAGETGRFAFQCTLAAPLDLDLIQSITIGGKTYPFTIQSK